MTSPVENDSACLGLNTRAFESIPAGVCLCDAQGLILYSNRRASEIWGREPRYLDGERFCGSPRIFDLVGRPVAHSLGPMAEVIRTGEPERDREAILERPDGSRVAVRAAVDPIRDAAGQVVGAIGIFQEIDGLSHPVEGSRDDEGRLRSLIAALPAAIYTTDPAGRITLFNEAAVDLWGRRPAVGEEMWCGSYRIFHPDGMPMPLDACPMAVALREGRSVRDQEIVIERPDGERRHVLPHPVPLRDASGEVVGAVNMLVDITGLKRSEDRLREGEARFRAIFESTPDCIKLVAPDGTLLEMNGTGLGMIEADVPEDVLGRSVFDLIAPEHREAFRAFNERVCRGEAGSLEFDLIGLRGTRRTMETRAVPFLAADGRMLHQAVTRDVTDRNRAQLERNLLAAIVESSDDAIASKGLDGVITSWNRGAERLFGYSADEVVGRHISMLMPPEHIEDTSRILDKIRRGERVDHYETRRRTKDGRIIDVSLTVSPLRDASGAVVGASKVARDITGSKRAVEALRRSEELLRQMNLRKDEFLAMLAHELRNPLSAISSAVQVARKSALDEPLAWSTEIIERQVTHLTRLIDDLLDVSRITRGKIRLRREVVDIGPILNGAVESVRPLIEERRHELTVSFRPGAVRMEADSVRIEQVVVNLLTNAAKYTDVGGRIWLTAEQAGGEVVIRVRDTGVGMPADKLPQMFELFAQDERTLARSEGGLGIGLTLVRSLVEMHQGSVSASSDGPGLGSEFIVRLPAASAHAQEPTAPATASGRGRHASRILIVDDNVDSVRGLARLLTFVGHEVRTAHDGPEAIAIAQCYRPDAVLLDIGLPGMDGYEVARRLREGGACRGSLIVAVTGYGQEGDRRRTREAGFDHHLVKPVDHDLLLSLICTDAF